MARRSLKDRNRAAITQTPEPAVTPTSPAESSAPEQTSIASSDTALLGLHLSRGMFRDMRAAFLADWSAGGQADTLGRWVGAALWRHADRTPAKRAELAIPATSGGISRTLRVPADAAVAMSRAIEADQQAGRWPSNSEWAVSAIAAAIDRAREVAGGTLPEPPERLPRRRLTR